MIKHQDASLKINKAFMAKEFSKKIGR